MSTIGEVQRVSTGNNVINTQFLSFISILLVMLIIIYFLLLKSCFGSYNIFEVIRIYQERKRLLKRYSDLFAGRDNLMYHISWAKSREEFDEAKRLHQELDRVDKVRF